MLRSSYFGIRLQILLALAGLMVLAFVPLFFAVASLTRTSMSNVREDSARSLGRAVASHIAEAQRQRPGQDLCNLLRSELGGGGLAAIGLYNAQGHRVASQGEHDALALLPVEVPPNTERTRTMWSSVGRVLEVLVPAEQSSVVAVLRTDDEAARATPLVRLVALYIGVFALALLVFTYMVITRMIVRPIDQLSLSAQSVAQGARRLEVPPSGARELVQLSTSLADMTRRLRDEEQRLHAKVEELERTTRELKSAQQTIVRSERLASVGRLAAGLAHEIGNPIAAILGLQELVLSGDLEPDEQRDFMVRIKAETERVHTVLRQLLDFARPAAASSADGPQSPGVVADAVRDAVSLVRPQKSFRDVEVSVDIAPDLPPIKLATSTMIQVLLNLLLNAGDATGGKGHVELVARRLDHGVQLVVSDDGPGVDGAVRDVLFEPFVTTKDVGAGTGLGLAVCRGLVEAAGGTIGVEDNEPSGARFVMWLPAAPAPCATAAVL